MRSIYIYIYIRYVWTILILYLFVVCEQRCLVVLYDIDVLLLVANWHSILWCETQGFLANVYTSHGHIVANVPQLGMQFTSCRLSRPCCSRLCRYIPGGRQIDQICQLSEGLRCHIRHLHCRLDCHTSGILSSHYLQVSILIHILNILGSESKENQIELNLILQLICWGSTHSAHVSSILHIQYAAFDASGAACDLDLYDSQDCDRLIAEGTGRCPVQGLLYFIPWLLL